MTAECQTCTDLDLFDRDGDIRFGTEEELLAAQPNLKPRAHSINLGDNVFGEGRWPEATVHYACKDQAAQDKLKTLFTSAIKHWTLTSPYLKFTDQGLSSAEQPGILTITANVGGGCYSSIGYQKDKIMHTNLAGDENKPCSAGAAAHEIGHALGKSKPT